MSYSHADHVACSRFLQFLEPLCERLGDEVWVDRDRLQAGDRWRDEIREALERAEVFIVLMSQHYRSSPFCIDKELAPTLRRQESDGVRVIGVALHELTLADFDVHLEDQQRAGLQDFQCLPQGVKFVDGVSRSGLVPMSKWPVEADAWHEVQVQLERALTLAAPLTTRVVAPAPPPAPQQSALLAPPYLCDRQPQSEDLRLVISEWHKQRCRRPLLIITEGDEQDCLSEWIERVSAFEFAKALPAFDAGELAFCDPGNFTWPSSPRDEADAQRRLALQFAERLSLNSSTPLAVLQADQVDRKTPMLWWSELNLSDGDEALVPSVCALAEILTAWPNLAPQGPLVLALNVVLDTPVDSKAVWARLADACQPTAFHLAALGRLPNVRKSDLTAWAKTRHVQPRLPHANVDALRERMSEPRPMREFVRLYDDWAAKG